MGETKRNIDMTNQTERPAENATPGAGPEIAADPRQMIAACNELGAMYRETGPVFPLPGSLRKRPISDP